MSIPHRPTIPTFSYSLAQRYRSGPAFSNTLRPTILTLACFDKFFSTLSCFVKLSILNDADLDLLCQIFFAQRHRHWPAASSLSNALDLTILTLTFYFEYSEPSVADLVVVHSKWQTLTFYAEYLLSKVTDLDLDFTAQHSKLNVTDLDLLCRTLETPHLSLLPFPVHPTAFPSALENS